MDPKSQESLFSIIASFEKAIMDFTTSEAGVETPTKVTPKEPVVREPGFDRFLSNLQKPIEEEKTPDNYNVILWNDDTTPVDVVMRVLSAVFDIAPQRAQQIMLAVHNSSKGIVCVLTKEEAEAKIVLAHTLARQIQTEYARWPCELTFTSEKV